MGRNLGWAHLALAFAAAPARRGCGEKMESDSFVVVSRLWSPVPGGVTAPIGFQAAGLTAGLKASGRPDLALLLAPEGAVCAGTFTTTVVRAACVDLCVERLEASGGRARAVLTNSGQANACTGERGLADSLTATAALARRLGLPPEEVLMCSTGVIGVPIPMDILLAGLEPLVEALSPEGGAPRLGRSSRRIWWKSRSPWRLPWVDEGCELVGWPRVRG